MNTIPSHPPAWPRWTIWLIGILLANLAIAVLYLAFSALFALFTRLETFEATWKMLGLTATWSLGRPRLFLVPLFGGADEILIHASPKKVWPLVTAFPDIPNPPRFWLFRIGLPYPMSTTTEGNSLGAKRACIFSGDAVFEEVVSELEVGKTLTFGADMA